ncbi:type 1 fimbrial protein [Cupriavidus necator]|uniref:Type 1 fimbrial protein n=1 Tax=Cupriavidus necator TaxID=106590 RepID=A0A1U9UP94_CUPNE|nr:fimbrial protein [Cupriavidus necator]AQV94544.1 type 1 fimbrial protein [Cupriavidus necator]
MPTVFRVPPTSILRILLIARQWILTALLLLAGSALPGVAAAGCSFAAGRTGDITLSVPASITVPRDTPVGSVIYTSTLNPPPYQVSVSCTSDPAGIINLVGSQPVSSTLFPIGNSGLSARWMYQSTSSFFGAYGAMTLVGKTGFGGTRHGIQIVKTGNIAAGATVPGGYVLSWDFGALNALRLTLSNSIAIVTQSCSTSDVTVKLGTCRTSDLRGPGTYAAATGFTIPVNNCPAGMHSVKFRINPATAIASGTSSVATLDGSSTASGVGVQLLDGNGTPYAFGTVTAVSGYNSGTGGSLSIPMQARYYQTAAMVGAGSANTAMILTMDYQ